MWWHSPRRRAEFEHGVDVLAKWLTPCITGTRFEYLLFLPIEDVGAPQIRVCFANARPWHVEVTTTPWTQLDPRWHPADLPHRYRDQRLCLWYPRDPRNQRWEWDDGLLELLGMTAGHLMRERLWLKTGAWFGPERPHGQEELWEYDPRAA